MSALRVHQVGPFSPWRGGIAHYNDRLRDALVAAGHEVRSVNHRRLYPDALFPGTSQVEAGRPGVAPDDGVLDSIGPASWLRVARTLQKERPDRLVVPWWHPFFAPQTLALLAGARAARVPSVLICHNVLPHEGTPLDPWVARAVYRCADALIVQARSEERTLRTLVPSATASVVPHPVYDLFMVDDARESARVEARRALGWPDDLGLFVFFGLVRPYKGLDVLLEAFSRLGDLPVGLIAAGECYGSAERYHAMHAGLPDPRRVRLDLRYLSRDEAQTLFRAADAVVLPYRHATQSGVIQTAYAAGRSVISTAVGGLPDVVDEGVSGLLVPPEDPDALAAAMRRFVEEDLRAPLESGVREVRTRFSWQALVDVIEGVRLRAPRPSRR